LIPILYRNKKVSEIVIKVDGFLFEFSIHEPLEEITFKIENNWSYGYGKLIKYCRSQICEIPVVFCGFQELFLFFKNKMIIRQGYISKNCRIECFGNSWERRYCRFFDVCFEKSNLSFYSPYKLVFKSPFALLGGRPPPSDKKRDRIYGLITHESTFSYPTSSTYHNRTFFYSSLYYNSHMLWHLYFDFVVPYYYTTMLFGLNNSRNSLILPKHSEKPQFLDSIASDISNPLDNHCYQDMIVGIYKNKGLNGLDYEFPNNISMGLQKLINLSEYPSSNKPKIIFVNRKSNTRYINNYSMILQSLSSMCTNYEFVETIFEEMEMDKQIALAHSSHMIIGAHGSGLSHLLWMKPNSFIIEILPYKFHCRNWYQKASVVSGMNYHSYHSLKPEKPTSQQKSCYKRPDQCASTCLEDLLAQNISIDPIEFSIFVKKVLHLND